MILDQPPEPTLTLLPVGNPQQVRFALYQAHGKSVDGEDIQAQGHGVVAA